METNVSETRKQSSTSTQNKTHQSDVGQVDHRVPESSSVSKGHQGFSKKLRDLVRREEARLSQGGSGASKKSDYKAKNWKGLSERQLDKLSMVERSRYLAYEPPPKEVLSSQADTLRRVRLARARQRELFQQPSLKTLIEAEKSAELMGQLKAAEAKQRYLLAGMEYEQAVADELNHLIAAQPSAMEAVRLESFIPLHLKADHAPELLSYEERCRCEQLLEDDDGLTTKRT